MDKDRLREAAARCRRLASTTTDRVAVARLMTLADGYEAQLARLSLTTEADRSEHRPPGVVIH